MANERKTENLVRDLLREQGYSDNENIIIEEQQSDNPRIDKLLNKASKSGEGKGYPEFIVSFKDKPNNLIVIECKADTKYHVSKTKKKYKDYAVDGVLLYANYLKDGFNVIAIAVSGETEREMRVSHFLWLKEKHTYKSISDKVLLDPKSLFNVVDQQSHPLKEEELNKKAIEYNELLHGYSIPEVDRCTVISSILVALQDGAFTNGFEDYHIVTDDDGDCDDKNSYNPNKSLINGLIQACTTVLVRNKITPDKQEIILREYGKIRSNHTLSSKTISVNRKDVINTVLRDLILDIKENIMPYVNNNIYDVLGSFYTRFIRYAGSDSKTGLVLTPHHITDLFCDLAEINENDIVFDPCCGTGGFLVSAMNSMIEKSCHDLAKQKLIKSKQLIGIEKRADMFSHSCSNMMMRGDGKSHIHFGDCFNNKLKESVRKEKPTKVFLNPPYDVGSDGQLEFIESAMEAAIPNAICVAICQMSTCTETKNATVEARNRLLNRHTLEAVLSMPDDLFYPVGVITSVLVFRAHTPHGNSKKTFFGYFKNDGFLKVKNKGRIDKNDEWSEIKKKWLSSYQNKENIAGLSIMQKVNARDEWCAEAYMETDYSILSNNNFIEVIKKYMAFKFLHGHVNSISQQPAASSQQNNGNEILFSINKADSNISVGDVFDVAYGVNLELNKMSKEKSQVPFVSRTSENNGVSAYVEEDQSFTKNPPNTLSVSGGGSVLEVFLQTEPYYSGRDLYYLTPKTSMTKLEMLFYSVLIKANKYRYNFGRQANKTLRSLSIPNFDSKYILSFMESLPYSSNLIDHTDQ